MGVPIAEMAAPRRGFSVRLSGSALRFPLRKRGASVTVRRVTGTVSFLTPVRNYVDALVHPGAQHDALTAARPPAPLSPRPPPRPAPRGGVPAPLPPRG